jgi:predicted MFS family arabinose efflux permease
MSASTKFYGWYLLGVLFALDFVNMGFPYFGGTVINSYMIRQIRMTRSTLGLGFTFINLAVGLTAPLVAVHIVKFGVRMTYVMGSALICAGSLFLAMFASKPWHFLVAFGIVNGVGIGFATMVTAATAVTRWFRRYRGRAIGIALSGSGISGFVVSWFLDRMLRTVGGNWRAGWYIVAAAALISGVVAFLFVKESPESMRQSVDGVAALEQDAPSRTDTLTSKHAWTTSEAYRTWAIWFIIIAGITSTYTSFFFVAHAILQMRAAGISSEKAAFAMGVFSVSMLMGRWMGGLLMDFINARVAYALGMVLVVIGSYYYGLVAHPDSALPAYIAAALYGSSHGWVFSCTATMTGHYYGVAIFPKLYGTMMLFISALAAPAGYIGGRMFDRYGSYTPAIICNAVLAVIGIIVILFATMPRPSGAQMTLQAADSPLGAGGS